MYSSSTQPQTHTPQLPTHLVISVLQYVDVQQRIRSCSRVCRAWNAAAVLGIDSISARVAEKQANSSSLDSWLARHGQHITSLRLNSDKKLLHPLDARQVPLQSLQQLKGLQCLQLYGVVLQPQQGISQIPVTTLTALTSLVLDNTDLAPAGGSQSLTSLSQLRRLQLGFVGGLWHEDGDGFLSQILAHLNQLTHLTLGEGCSVEDLACIDQLQQLQELVLQEVPAPDDALNKLPASLTRLAVLKPYGHPLVISVSGTPEFTRLTALQHLELLADHCGFVEGACAINVDHGILSHLVQLTHLTWSSPVFGSDTSSVLSALAQLSNLQHLDLGGTLRAPAAALEHYSALCSSSSSLSYLDLSNCNMPLGFLRHAVPAGLQQTTLKGLRVLLVDDPNAEFLADYGAVNHLAGVFPELAMLELTLESDFQDGMNRVQLSAIPQLTQLASLSVKGKGFDGSFVPELSRLVGLETLNITCCIVCKFPPGQCNIVSWPGWELAQVHAGDLVNVLTQLTRLTHLTISAAREREQPPQMQVERSDEEDRCNICYDLCICTSRVETPIHQQLAQRLSSPQRYLW